MVSRLDLVRHGMRERPLCDVPRIPVLTSPIAEAAAKAVRRRYASRRIALRFHTAQKGCENHVAQDRPARRRKDKRLV